MNGEEPINHTLYNYMYGDVTMYGVYRTIMYKPNIFDMRAITKKAVSCFLNNESFSSDNTVVEVGSKRTVLKLFGNSIAYKHLDGSIEICNGGYYRMTATTRERLNGIPGVKIHKEKGVWYLNGEMWDGTLTKI